MVKRQKPSGQHVARLVVSALDEEEAIDRAITLACGGAGYRAHVNEKGAWKVNTSEDTWEAIVIYTIL